MDELRLPQNVIIHVLGADGQPLRVPDILYRVDTKPRRKNPYRLGPYPTDEFGIISITRDLLEAEIDATMESGLMDYVGIESSYPEIIIAPYSRKEIEKAVDSRTHVWKALLKGEDRRWNTIEELIALYRRSQNHRYQISESPEPSACAFGTWTVTDTQHDYTVTLQPKNATSHPTE